jgi:DNA-binding FrmR family transcriptional regulator
MSGIKPQNRQAILNRLRRIEGQIRGLERLVQSEAPCLDILTQVSAVTAAVKKVGTEVVELYIDHCLSEVSANASVDREKKMKDFQKALSRYIDMA